MWHPLCPAGHLPHRWGDWIGAPASPNNHRRSRQSGTWAGRSCRLPISPLVGEMPGRAEGGYHTVRPLHFVSIP
ncbi:hypothetical protein ELH72_12315 [Rhizobium ruizarguesonis]|nr:hypothetical protein [Rhizobium leguminosarum bv. viciae]TAZ83970.1 hypothetical protein ELH72_12315 [Rhizobium ruizarguesonis]